MLTMNVTLAKTIQGDNYTLVLLYMRTEWSRARVK